ncbi:39S ribosomal protein L50, mitochondrial [Pseudolycoriella hygida]|uniref:Large ribosomal subunit protein mL50 n=1 Tax=Pseudolycoriella hygida TaxID=35572 RepID=A0A9Q0SA26_9DIPT|nr:39S ribosomal protein L50, mitochondrial [Pseudolycoriella hygida]
MAALVRHVLRKTGQEIPLKCIIPTSNGIAKRNYSNKLPKTVETGQKIDALAKSLECKGYLRSQKSYTPPSDVLDKIDNILSSSSITDTSKSLNLTEKFHILKSFDETFNHSVPNSQLHEISCIDDIIKFYNTEVNTTVPLDALKNMDLPSNLHIQHEYLRFHPETDSMFGGQTAFPRSSTIVTGLKYKQKYKGHVVKTSWP